MMKRLLARLVSNPAIIVTAVLLAVWWVLTLLFTPALLLEAASTFAFVLCVIGLVRWGKTGWRVFWQGARRPEDWGILAIDFIFLSYGSLRIYALIFRQLGRPDWLQDSHFAGFLVFLTVCALALFIAATKDEPPTKD